MSVYELYSKTKLELDARTINWLNKTEYQKELLKLYYDAIYGTYKLTTL